MIHSYISNIIILCSFIHREVDETDTSFNCSNQFLWMNSWSECKCDKLILSKSNVKFDICQTKEGRGACILRDKND